MAVVSRSCPRSARRAVTSLYEPRWTASSHSPRAPRTCCRSTASRCARPRRISRCSIERNGHRIVERLIWSTDRDRGGGSEKWHCKSGQVDASPTAAAQEHDGRQYRHIGGFENRLGRHYSRFSPSWPAPPLAAQSLAAQSLARRKSRTPSRIGEVGLRPARLPWSGARVWQATQAQIRERRMCGAPSYFRIDTRLKSRSAVSYPE